MKKVLQSLIEAMAQSRPDISFEVAFWDGELQRFGDGPPAFSLHFKNKRAVRRVLRDGFLGFGEEYMHGGLAVEGDLQQLLRLGLETRYRDLHLSFWNKVKAAFFYLTRRNTLGGSRRNIAHHYDLGNDFYRLWLDKSMTYSCAYFRSANDSLEQAQDQKHEHICRKLNLQPGETLLDIGCGWGAMLIYAAKHYGVRGVGCTLSRNQFDYARERIKEEGLEGQVTVLFQDYRTLDGTYDKFVSIGMFEHVGKKFIPTYFDVVKRVLKPGGVGLLHTIGRDRHMEVSAWVQKYIFPGGYLPALDEIVRAMGQHGMTVNDVENLRLHYGRTLDEWARRFEAQVDTVREMFDDTFVRMWRLFLNSSSAGFKYGDNRVFHVTFTNGLNNRLPMTRDHLYLPEAPAYVWSEESNGQQQGDAQRQAETAHASR
jgi:cyclopropane-fatty-acyl-phospholipid synthase